MEVTLEAFRKRYQYESPKDLIGKGGFSDVYKAWDTQDEQFVALKIATASPGEKYNLVSEIKKIKKLKHPNLINYYEVYEVSTGTKDIHGNALNYQVAVMEYAEGGTLADLLKKRILKYTEAEEMAQGIINGLAFLHSNNITHRDLKPANILITHKDCKPIPKITDFGIAKDNTLGNTASTLLVGTVEYMAPEFFNEGANQKVSSAADVWSLGVIILEAITGIHPFGKTSQGKNNEQIIYNILSSDINPGLQNLHAPFKELVTRCLIREPNLRPQNAEELNGFLHKTEDNFAERTQIITKPKPIKNEPGRGNVIIKRTVLAFFCLLIIATGLFFFQKFRIENRVLVPVYSSTGYYGFNDAKSGEIVIPLKFDYADSFYDGRAKVLIDGRFGFIDKKGELVVKPTYEEAHHFNEGLAAVGIKKDDEIIYGYIDKSGKEIITPQYDEAKEFDFGLANVSLDSRRQGVINKQGIEMVPLQDAYSNVWKNFIYVYKVNRSNHELPPSQYEILSHGGKEIVPYKYASIGSFNNGLALVSLPIKPESGERFWKGKLGWVNEHFEEVIPCKYDRATEFHDGVAVVSLDNKCFFINEKGVTTPLKYDAVDEYGDGLYIAGYITSEKSGIMGYIDQTGKEIIPIKYEDGKNFVKGIAPVKLNGKWGYIDKRGNQITRFIYDYALELLPEEEGGGGFNRRNHLNVELNGKYGALDKNGKEVLPCIYDQLVSTDKFGAVLAKLNGFFGVIDTLGNVKIPFRYKNLYHEQNFYIFELDDDNFGVLDNTGSEILRFKGINRTLYKRGLTIRDDRLIELATDIENKWKPLYWYNIVGRTVREF